MRAARNIRETMTTKIIFLDVDGVLCINGRLNNDCTRYLKQIIDVTNANVVLSSNWRLSEKFYNRIYNHLKEFGISIYGATNNFNDDRALEILFWVKYYNITHWIAFDDRNLLQEFSVLRCLTFCTDDFDKDFKTIIRENTTSKLKNKFLMTNLKKGIEFKHIKMAVSNLNK